LPAADGRVQLGHQFGRREAWHSAQRKTAKQNYGGIIIFDLFIRAFNLPTSALPVGGNAERRVVQR